MEETSIREAQDGPKRIKIDVPEVYKQTNEEVWEELEKYLFTGFLSSPAIVANHNFVFKSLNHYELKNIEFMRPASSAPTEVKSLFRCHFIAHSVFMIDGSNVLFERPKHINKLIRVVSRLAPRIQEKIIENLAALNARAHRLYPLTEFYVQEAKSRYRWLQISNIPVHSSMSTGVHGTDTLGMNYAQQTWVAVNRANDRRDEIERDWANAKFIGSCMSKGVRSIDERDRGRAEKERVEFEDRRLKALYTYLNRIETGEDPPEAVRLPDGRMATVTKKHQADSVQELAFQLESALSGEKDHHDLVVQKTLQKMHERSKVIEEQRARIHTLPAIDVGGEEVSSGGPSRIIGGPREAEVLLARMRKLKQDQLAAIESERIRPDLSDPIEGSDGNRE